MYNRSIFHVSSIVTGIPVTLILFPTNRCNLGCDYCIYYKHGRADAFNPTDELLLSNIKRIVSNFYYAGGKAVQISGGGEPTLHPNFSDILWYVDKFGMDIGIITNGTTPIDIDRLSTLKWIRVSVDAASNSIYNQVKHSNKFTDVCNNIINMVRNRKQGVSIGTSFIISRTNYTDIPDFAKMSHELGVDYCRYTYALTPKGSAEFNDINDDIVQMMGNAEVYNNIRFRVIAQYDRLKLMDTVDRTYIRCRYSDLVKVIGADGYLYPCCELSYIDKYRIRNILDDMEFQCGISVRECPACDMDSKNVELEVVYNSCCDIRDINFL